MRSLLISIALVSAASVASATTQQYYQRVDAAQVAKTRAWLQANGHSGVSVRSFRGRITLGGALPQGAARVEFLRAVRHASGAISVHPS